MKESLNNNAFNDIPKNDIIIKTKSTFQGFVSGVKKLFCHPSKNSGEVNRSSTEGINNYLKSPEEIEAELRFLASPQGDNNSDTLMVAFNSYSAIIDKQGVKSETGDVQFILPDYMEENY